MIQIKNWNKLNDIIILTKDTHYIIKLPITYEYPVPSNNGYHKYEYHAHLIEVINEYKLNLTLTIEDVEWSDTPYIRLEIKTPNSMSMQYNLTEEQLRHFDLFKNYVRTLLNKVEEEFKHTQKMNRQLGI